VKPGDIVRHPDGSLGVVERVYKTMARVRWVADTAQDDFRRAVSTDNKAILEPTGARVENYETL
jgi:hypothetical protein